MKCPQCGGQTLQIEVEFHGSLACRFSSEFDFEVIEPASLNSEWGEDSRCECLYCFWSGTVREAQCS